MTGMRRLLRWSVGGFTALTAYHLMVRPWHRRWGATDEELARVLPGDELRPPSPFRDTRAITIRAPADEVWPWLAQMGWGRGAFYTYNVLENLFGGDLHNAEELHPEWQSLEVGDEILLAPPARFGDVVRQTVVALEPGRSIVLATPERPDGAWTLLVEPVDAETSRLLVRWQTNPRDPLWAAFAYLVLEPAHALMETGMLRGIKCRAERAHGRSAR